MTAVVVTGAGGFLGRPLLVALQKRGCSVHAFGRRAAPVGLPPAVVWHRIDLRDRASTAALLSKVRAQGLIHLAWETAHLDYWRSPENVPWTALSIDLLVEFGRAGGKRVVIAGSSAEYDWSAPSPMQETHTPLRPASLYGHCKNALRQVVEAWAAPAGVSWAWGRVFNIFGAGEKPQRLVPRVIRSLMDGRKLPFDEGGLVRDFLHVDDAADAFAALYASQFVGAMNIASGQPVAIRDLVLRIAQILGRSALVELGALPPPEGEPQEVVASVDELRRIGCAPKKSLDERLEQTCDWWRARVASAPPEPDRNS